MRKKRFPLGLRLSASRRRIVLIFSILSSGFHGEIIVRWKYWRGPLERSEVRIFHFQLVPILGTGCVLTRSVAVGKG